MIENNFNKGDYIAPPEDRFSEKESTKNHVIAGVLALFLGTFGIHNFYLGNTKMGIIQLVMALTGIFCFISTVWGICDAFLLFSGKINKDSNGNILL